MSDNVPKSLGLNCLTEATLITNNIYECQGSRIIWNKCHTVSPKTDKTAFKPWSLCCRFTLALLSAIYTATNLYQKAMSKQSYFVKKLYHNKASKRTSPSREEPDITCY